MPRLHSASHYHSRPRPHPHSHPHPPSSIMSSIPFLHHPPLKSRPLQSLCSSNSPPPLTSNHHSKRIHSSPGLSLMACSAPSCSDRLSKSVSEKIPPSEPVSALLPKQNRKATPKRARKPREKPSSTSTTIPTPLRRLHSPSDPVPSSIDPSPTNSLRSSKSAATHSKSSHSHQQQHALSLYDLCDQLSTTALDRSLSVVPSPPHTSFKPPRSSTKKKSTPHRKLQKGSQPLAQACLQSSDAEDVLTFDHSTFLPNDDIPSRTTTPSPTRILGSNPYSASPDDHEQVHETFVAPRSANRKPSITVPFISSRVNPSGPRRQHVRAKSVASIFDIEKRQAPKSRGAKDDWDMPSGVPSRGLTWQQMEKKQSSKNGLSATNSNPTSQLTQKLWQHNTLQNASSTGPPTSSITFASSTQNSKETSARRQRTSLCRTSSAGVLSRLTKTSSAPNRTSSPVSRSDDESPLTWQQSILRPLPKNSSHVVVHHNQHKTDVADSKPGHHHKKNLLPVAFKTPSKPPPSVTMPRKVGVNSANRPKSSALQSHGKRRNSLCSARAPNSEPSVGLETPQQVAMEWKPFSSCAITKNHNTHQLISPPFSNPLPSAATQSAQTPQRRHAKSYTDQPAILTDRLVNQSQHPHSHIPDSKDTTMLTPSKSRTTSEDLNLAAPGIKLESSALRAAIMYAGPQFHNSPCPAALPAPKFSFGSA